MTELAGEGCQPVVHLPPAPGTVDALLVEVCEALDTDLDTLDEPTWSVPVVCGMDVLATVAHLTAEHRAAIDMLTGRTVEVSFGHLDDLTDIAIADAASLGSGATRAAWRDSVHLLRTAIAAGGASRAVRWLGCEVDAQHVALDRAFSTWLHANDIRRASNRSSLDPSGEHLKLLCDYVVELLPAALERSGRCHDALLQVQLSGPGGGAWTVALGAGEAVGATGILQASARELCLLLGGRIDPVDFACTVRGTDAAVVAARDLVACAPVFSRR